MPACLTLPADADMEKIENSGVYAVVISANDGRTKTVQATFGTSVNTERGPSLKMLTQAILQSAKEWRDNDDS
jgi:hypothetical protein